MAGNVEIKEKWLERKIKKNNEEFVKINLNKVKNNKNCEKLKKIMKLKKPRRKK